MTRRLVLMAAALLLVLAACGSGVEDGSDITVDNKPDSTETTQTTDTTTPDNSDIPPGQDPRNILGDDEDLNDLANACFDPGDMFACDQLFAATEVDSDLEAYSQTCGGRIEEQDGAPDCADRFDVSVPDAAPPADFDDVDFNDLADQCFEGDFGACDQLFQDTPVGSDAEAYGSTCGERIAAGVRGSCENLLGSADDSSGGATPTTAGRH